MSYYIFVDNSNVWIEGKFHSAVNKGFASNIIEAHDKLIQDNSWAIDFGRLLFEVTESKIDEIASAIMFGSKPPQNDSLWDAMRQAGFEVHNLDRNIVNKEKKVDTGIVAEILKMLYTRTSQNDTFILIMGDSDFVPVISQIRDKGVKSIVAFWDNVSGELKKEADSYLSLNDVIDSISYR